MSLRVRLSLCAALTASVALPSTSFADSTGVAGSVTAVTIHESSSDEYGTFNGSVTVREGNDASGTAREYKWGGSLCAGKNVGADDVRLLTEAMRARSDLQIVPSYKIGNGATRCLTGFKIRIIEAGPR